MAGVGRGRAVELDDLLEAALRVVDTHGVEALTMRRLASDLGVNHMAAYRYVRSKDELLRLVAGFVVRDVPPPAPDTPWELVLQEFFEALYDRFVRYPGVARLYGSDVLLGETVFAVAEPVFRSLLDAGFDADEAVTIFMTCGSIAVGGATLGTGAEAGDDRVLVIPSDRFPSIAQVLQQLPTRQARERIVGGLARVIRSYSESAVDTAR